MLHNIMVEQAIHVFEAYYKPGEYEEQTIFDSLEIGFAWNNRRDLKLPELDELDLYHSDKIKEDIKRVTEQVQNLEFYGHDLAEYYFP